MSTTFGIFAYVILSDPIGDGKLPQWRLECALALHCPRRVRHKLMTSRSFTIVAVQGRDACKPKTRSIASTWKPSEQASALIELLGERDETGIKMVVNDKGSLVKKCSLRPASDHEIYLRAMANTEPMISSAAPQSPLETTIRPAQMDFRGRNTGSLQTGGRPTRWPLDVQ